MLEELREKHRGKVVIFTVFLALFIDHILFSIVVPILPDYLIRIKGNNDSAYLEASLHRVNLTNFTAVTHEGEYHEAFASTNIPVALLLGTKAVVQIPAGILVSHMTYRIGYAIPVFCGFMITFASSLMFAFSTSYWMLLIARGMNGVGAGFSAVAGMGFLADTFPDNHERGRAISLAFGGIAIGILAGPVVGGVLYHYGGMVLPFVSLATLSLIVGLIQFIVLRPKVSKARPEPTNYSEFLTDPYIIIVAVGLWFGNFAFSMLEPALPLYMVENWGSNSALQGIAFLPSSLAYLIGANVFGFLSKHFRRWLCSFAGFLMIATMALVIPFAQNIYHLIIPNAILGFGLGLVDTNLIPMLGHIADLRHTAVYGSVYAIGDAAACLAFAVGPFVAGPVVRYYGFLTLMIVISVSNLIIAPFMFVLRRLPETVEKKAEISAASENPSFSSSSDNTKEKSEATLAEAVC
ncbi:unnamed protein product [Bursaphelenchus xylophilus]|uniref:(pine wood nematode) hypothetical protein n=1 Tax=Bursaphelenchus xylophilus TaxID=6326 RepID=A0A1I7RJJ8_BURXY|nr:unnamed protein product [Bursaphelenchus xylophilus]CAG9128922.1 unnamed protein product [Bursaphelenchus xylophilus]